MVFGVTRSTAAPPSAPSAERFSDDAAPDATTRLPQLFAGAPSRIRDHLYLGSYSEANTLETLQRLGITQVINVTRHRACPFADALVYQRIAVDDTPRETLAPYFCRVAT